MADTAPSPVSFGKALWLCLLLVVAPGRFIAEENQDIEWRKNNPSTIPRPSKARIVRRALLGSLLLVLLAAAVGYGAGRLTQVIGWCFAANCVAWIQIAGASLLLWGTLFVRGYEISTWSGVTYSERINQWLYRAMYCIGTSVAVFSLAVQQCKT